MCLAAEPAAPPHRTPRIDGARSRRRRSTGPPPCRGVVVALLFFLPRQRGVGAVDDGPAAVVGQAAPAGRPPRPRCCVLVAHPAWGVHHPRRRRRQGAESAHARLAATRAGRRGRGGSSTAAGQPAWPHSGGALLARRAPRHGADGGACGVRRHCRAHCAPPSACCWRQKRVCSCGRGVAQQLGQLRTAPSGGCWGPTRPWQGGEPRAATSTRRP